MRECVKNPDREMFEAFLEEKICCYKEKSGCTTSWKTPVVGIADASDEKFPLLKEIIHPEHALPQDIVPGARSVLVYFVPFSEEIVKSNVSGEESSREWDLACIHTNQLLIELNRNLHEKLTGLGYQASVLPPTEEKLVSNWSHKSVAYIAGIGKFGLNQVLITEKGCCGRIGSVITDMPLQPTPFQEEEYCLYYKKEKCRACIKRCPNQAFSLQEGKITYDRYLCNQQIYDKVVPVYPEGTGDSCGKCMSGVPCSCGIPT